ncbi:uncharacterized protein C2orf81 homolog [Ciconia maguari]
MTHGRRAPVASRCAARRGRGQRCRGDRDAFPPGGAMGEKTTPRERAAASKSRGEKSRPPTVAAAAAARADIVPGRLPEAEWLSLLAAERGDGDAGDVLAELLARVMDECSKANAARQRVPFAVGQARDALLRVARWRFLARDEGETDPAGDGAWQEDEEPEPCAGDSWARGSVPVLRVRPSPCPGDGEVSGAQASCRRGRRDPPAAAEAGALPTRPLCPGQVPAASAVLPVPGLSCPELLPDEAATAPRPPVGKPPRARPPLPRPAPLCPGAPGPAEEGRRPLRSSHGDAEGSGAAGVGGHGPPLPPPSCSGPARIRPGRPPRSAGAKQEGSGTALGVPRLGPGSRPERWIRPQVEVLDPGAEAKPPARPQGARWRSRGPELGSAWLPRGLVTVGGGRLRPPAPGSLQPPSPLPRQLGSLLDCARLAPGVTIRQGGGVKHGLCVPAHGEEEEEEEEEEATAEAKRDLRPIRPPVPSAAVAAGQGTGDGER